MTVSVLVVVHPGSACGSADFNLGEALARGRRDRLIREISAWTSGVIIIDGELSDELERPPYARLGTTLKNALTRAASAGFVGTRVMGDDPTQMRVIRRTVESLGIDKPDAAFVVTGAWYDADGSGCVGSVVDALRADGYYAVVAPGAISLDADLGAVGMGPPGECADERVRRAAAEAAGRLQGDGTTDMHVRRRRIRDE